MSGFSETELAVGLGDHIEKITERLASIIYSGN
jgi:hypothetical protein